MKDQNPEVSSEPVSCSCRYLCNTSHVKWSEIWWNTIWSLLVRWSGLVNQHLPAWISSSIWHTLSDRIAWYTNICQPTLHPLSDTPGQIENIGALSTTGLTLLTSGLVDWPQRRYQVLLLQDWAVLQLHGRHLTLDQQGNHQVLGKCSLELLCLGTVRTFCQSKGREWRGCERKPSRF